MALQTSAPISLLDIDAEFSGPATPSLRDFLRNGSFVPDDMDNQTIGTSGTISLLDFLGAKAFRSMTAGSTGTFLGHTNGVANESPNGTAIGTLADDEVDGDQISSGVYSETSVDVLGIYISGTHSQAGRFTTLEVTGTFSSGGPRTDSFTFATSDFHGSGGGFTFWSWNVNGFSGHLVNTNVYEMVII